MCLLFGATSCKTSSSKADKTPPAEWNDCPVERTYGDPGAEYHLVFENAYGKRTLHFDTALTYLDEREPDAKRLVIESSSFGAAIGEEGSDPVSIELSVDSFDPMQAEQPIAWSPPRESIAIDCMAFELGGEEDGEEDGDGTLKLEHFVRPADEPGQLEARISLEGSKETATKIRGRINTGQLVSKRFEPLDGRQITFGVGDRYTAEKVHGTYDPNGNRLSVQLLDPEAQKRLSLEVVDFQGRPGVYYGEEPNTERAGAGRAIFVVQQFDAEQTSLTARWAFESELGDELPTDPVEAIKLGEEVGTVQLSHVTRYPKLEPVDLMKVAASDVGREKAARQYAPCPAGGSFGPADAKHVVRLQTQWATYTYRIPVIRTVLRGDALVVDFPPIGFGSKMSRLKISSAEFDPDRKELPVEASVELARIEPLGCRGLPELRVQDAVMHILDYRAPADKPGYLKARVDIPGAGQPDTEFSIEIDGDYLVQLDRRTALGEDNGIADAASGDSFEVIDKGSFVYDQGSRELQMNLVSEDRFRKTGVRNMPDAPGIYVGKLPYRQTVSVLVIDAFGGSELRLRRYALDPSEVPVDLPEEPNRWVPTDKLTRKQLTRDGQLRLRVDTDALVVLPALDPLEWTPKSRQSGE
ncbi:MAG: hypothetical protein ACLFVJ_22480 [Persicimonas sp.]